MSPHETSMRKIMVAQVLFSIWVQVSCVANEGLRGQSIIYGISSLNRHINESTECQQSLKELYDAINLQRFWGLKVMDSSGEPGPGFLYGNNLWLGSQTECQDAWTRTKMQVNYDRIKRPEPTEYDYPPYPLKYTVVYMKHNNTLQNHIQLPLEYVIQLGLCLPKSCKEENVYYLLNKYFQEGNNEFQQRYHLDLDIFEIKIITNGLWVLSLSKTIALISIIGILLLLVIFATIYDVRKHKREKNIVLGHNLESQKQNVNTFSTIELVPGSQESLVENTNLLGECFKCFSLYSNNKALFKTKLSPDSVGCIHGIRFLGMMWVSMVHAIFYLSDFISNPVESYNLAEPFMLQIFSNATYCVDTFLLLSGFLTAYLFFKAPNKSKNIITKISNFFEMVINRFLRLTPAYLVTLLMTNVIFTYYNASSPMLTNEQPNIQCDQHWWRNLLYINNLYPRSEMCMSWSWYLSLDMQMFVISIILLLLSTVSFTLAAMSVFVLIFINIGSMVYKTYMIGYIPTMDEQLRTLDDLYDLPWQRCGPYMVGLITAYILFVKMGGKLVIGMKTKFVLWCVFPILNLWILFTLYNRKLSLEYSSIYMGLSRTLWGVGIAWILIVCCTRNARALEKFLSFKGFIPLSRLTYCAYLVNPLAIYLCYYGSGKSTTGSYSGFTVSFGGTVLISFMIGYILSMMVESPSILLTKLVLKKLSKPRKPKSGLPA